MADALRLLVLGAHPDDAEFHAGGLALRFRAAGHTVRFVSVTDGSAGHHAVWGLPLTALRRGEAQAAANSIGAQSAVWDYPDGRLESTLALRFQIVRELRAFQPDLVLTHRTCDYHPDHRAVGHAVRDASYLVTVPALASDTPALTRDPVVAYLPDRFRKPNPLAADILVDVTDQFSSIVALLACHESQVFEWLPWQQGRLDDVPTEAQDRRNWLGAWYGSWLAQRNAPYRSLAQQRFANPPTWFEVFEVSEYAAPLDEEARRRLFGWLGSAVQFG